MTDIYSKRKRSQIMSKISGKETMPEILVRKHLFSKGFRFRKNVKKLPGKPDIVLPKYKTVIFIHGCFWHGHKNCKASKLPETRRAFWEEKIAGNIERDKRNITRLKNERWETVIVWQCEISSREKRQKRFKVLEKGIWET